MKITVYDHGLNTEAAIKLASAGHTVAYYSEWREAWPKCVNESVGLGLDGITRVNDFFAAAERSHLVCFFDTNSADVLLHFRREHPDVLIFGAGDAEKLERDRSFCKELLKAQNLPIAPYQLIKGVDKLIDHLRDPKNKDRWVKIDGQFRGDNETFHHEDWDTTMSGDLGSLLMAFGPMSNSIEFMVEEPIKSQAEVGYDGFASRGLYTDGLVGYESKDKSYFGAFTTYSKMPKCIKDSNHAVSAVFENSFTPTIFSTELRLTGKDDKPYLIDPCVRAPHPPLAAELEAFGNWSQVVTDLASGKFTNPAPTAKYACVVEVYSSQCKEHFCKISFDEKYRHLVKLQRACKIGSDYWTLPGSVIACNVVGLGNTIEKAKAECVKVLDTVKCGGMTYDLDSLDLLVEETIPAGRKMGIDF